MLKSRRHAVDLRLAEAMPRGFVAPLRDGVANLFLRLCGLCLRPDRNTSPPPIARASDAVLSSSLIAVVRMRGLMPVGTDFRSYACDRRQAYSASGRTAGAAFRARRDDEINTVAWEAVALALAAKAGIAVPDSRVETVQRSR